VPSVGTLCSLFTKTNWNRHGKGAAVVHESIFYEYVSTIEK
jgi:hypothetical protein